MSRLSFEAIVIANLKQELDPNSLEYRTKEIAYMMLKDLTGQDFGDDIEAWENWVRDHGLGFYEFDDE